MYETIIISVGHFSSFINFTIFGDIGKRSSSSRFVYRGQPASADGKALPLVPKVGRESFRRENPEYNHAKAFKDWAKMGAGFTTGKSGFEVMSSAQHFGLPTPLLDWSNNPYTALWFACLPDEGGVECDADVFCLNKTQELLRPDASVDDLSIAFHDPRWIDARMRAQQAAFTFHPKLQPLDLEQLSREQSKAMCRDAVFLDKELSKVYADSDFKPHENFKGYREYISAGKFHNLCRLKIPGGAKRIILNELDSMGINYSSVYPDAEGLVRYLQWIQRPGPKRGR